MVFVILLLWIAIYPVDSAIQLLNNQDLMVYFFVKNKQTNKVPSSPLGSQNLSASDPTTRMKNQERIIFSLMQMMMMVIIIIIIMVIMIIIMIIIIITNQLY